MNGGSAISHLHHFCGRLPRERFVDRRPVFAIKSIEGQGLLQATVTLPSCVEPGVRIGTGVGWWRTERVAKQEAALNACVALYRAGLINDNFLPVCQDKLPIEKDLVAKSRVEVDVRTDPWLRISQAWSSSGQCFHQLRVSFSENGLDRPDLAIILTSPVSLPPWPTLNLHWGSDLCFISKSTSLPFPASFSESELELMQQATRILTQSVQGNQAADKALDYLILCTPDIPRLHLQGWIKRYSGSRTLENYPQNRDIASFGLIRHACLFRPHRLHRWFQSDPESELLFECHPFPRRRNLFHQGQSSKVVKADESNCRTKIVSAKSAHIDLLPWELARIGGFLPTIISHIRVLKMAEGLRQRVIAAVPLNDLELIATAIVAPSAQWVANYQRLEFLGDSVLKYATCIHLFQAHSTWHEGYLSQRKSHLVSNTSLLNAAFRLGLISFLLNDTLVKRKQLLPTISNCIQDERNARQIRVRSAADVVESLIGAAFVEGGVRKAYKMIHLFIPDIPSDMNPFNSPTGSGGSHLNGDVQKLISRLMGYSFHKNQILLEGLTHPSWERDLSPSYQRLEFLGDAILDMIVTRLLFERCPGLSESRMSKIRAAVVNADFLAYLCMDFAVLEDTTLIVERKKGHFEPVADTRRVELWKFMRHHNPDITHAQNTCLNRFSRLQSRINIALNQQRRHPWALLAELEAEKFYSDLVESLVGAVFVDSSGSLSCCEDFLIQIGLVSYLDRILDDEIDVEHPRAVLSHITPDKEVNYLFGCDPLGSHSVTVIIQGEAVAHVEECRSRAEAVLRGADEAAQKLRIASLGRSISQVII